MTAHSFELAWRAYEKTYGPQPIALKDFAQAWAGANLDRKGDPIPREATEPPK